MDQFQRKIRDSERAEGDIRRKPGHGSSANGDFQRLGLLGNENENERPEVKKMSPV